MRPHREAGFGLAALLVTLFLLGLMAVGTLIGLEGLSGSSTTAAGSSPTGTFSPAGTSSLTRTSSQASGATSTPPDESGLPNAQPSAPIRASLVAACQADASSVDVAQEAFRAESTSGAFASGVGVLVRGDFLRSSPGNVTSYRIATGITGTVEVTNVRSGVTASFETDPSICATV